MALLLVPGLLFHGAAFASVDGNIDVNGTLSEERGSPRARIVVKSIKDTTGHCHSEAEGITQMLITALNQSGHFLVLEGDDQVMGDLSQEQQIGGFGRSYEGADIVLTGALTAFETNTGSASAGIGGLLSKATAGIPLLQGSGSGTQVQYGSAYVACDLRLADTRTRRLIGTTKAQGKAREMGLSGLGVDVNNVPLVSGLSMYSRTPVEKAIRNVLEESVHFIVKKTPKEYYRGPKSETETASGVSGGASGSGAAKSGYIPPPLLDENDYFILSKKALGQMLAKPTGSGGMAKILVYHTGEMLFLEKDFYKLIPADKSVEPGKDVVFSRDIFHTAGDVFLPPKNQDEARAGENWNRGVLVESKHFDDGYVSVSWDTHLIKVASQNLWLPAGAQ
jgi:curli biogenesis system outer membrane secretion channel CsgG